MNWEIGVNIYTPNNIYLKLFWIVVSMLNIPQLLFYIHSPALSICSWHGRVTTMEWMHALAGFVLDSTNIHYPRRHETGEGWGSRSPSISITCLGIYSSYLGMLLEQNSSVHEQLPSLNPSDLGMMSALLLALGASLPLDSSQSDLTLLNTSLTQLSWITLLIPGPNKYG